MENEKKQEIIKDKVLEKNELENVSGGEENSNTENIHIRYGIVTHLQSPVLVHLDDGPTGETIEVHPVSYKDKIRLGETVGVTLKGCDYYIVEVF